MAKTNQRGRSKNEPFVKLHRGVTSSEAWKSLTCEARCLLIEIWSRHNGQNNGRIPLSHKEARKSLRVGSRKVAAAFRDLQDRGFIIPREKGSFDWKVAAGQGKATEWEITTEPCDRQPPKATYRDWPKKKNTGTSVVAAGNRTGNRSAKSRPQKPPNGNHSSCRSTPQTTASGNYSGDTYNIPGSGPLNGAGPTKQGRPNNPLDIPDYLRRR